MSLPFIRKLVKQAFGFSGDVTPLNCEEQFKPFVYLNVGRSRLFPGEVVA